MQVWLSAWSVLTVHFVAFIIQSAAFSAEHLESRVDAFVESCTQLLETMPEEEYASQVRMSPPYTEGTGQRHVVERILST